MISRIKELNRYLHLRCFHTFVYLLSELQLQINTSGKTPLKKIAQKQNGLSTDFE